MHPHPQLTRTQYQALRRHYRLSRREDALAEARMPVLASTWRRNAPKRAAVVAATAGPALAATFCRPEAPRLDSVARVRLAQRIARRGRRATLAAAIAKLPQVAA